MSSTIPFWRIGRADHPRLSGSVVTEAPLVSPPRDTVNLKGVRSILSKCQIMPENTRTSVFRQRLYPMLFTCITTSPCLIEMFLTYCWSEVSRLTTRLSRTGISALGRSLLIKSKSVVVNLQGAGILMKLISKSEVRNIISEELLTLVVQVQIYLYQGGEIKRLLRNSSLSCMDNIKILLALLPIDSDYTDLLFQRRSQQQDT